MVGVNGLVREVPVAEALAVVCCSRFESCEMYVFCSVFQFLKARHSVCSGPIQMVTISHREVLYGGLCLDGDSPMRTIPN